MLITGIVPRLATAVGDQAFPAIPPGAAPVLALRFGECRPLIACALRHTRQGDGFRAHISRLVSFVCHVSPSDNILSLFPFCQEVFLLPLEGRGLCCQPHRFGLFA